MLFTFLMSSPADGSRQMVEVVFCLHVVCCCCIDDLAVSQRAVVLLLFPSMGCDACVSPLLVPLFVCQMLCLFSVVVVMVYIFTPACFLVCLLVNRFSTISEPWRWSRTLCSRRHNDLSSKPTSGCTSWRDSTTLSRSHQCRCSFSVPCVRSCLSGSLPLCLCVVSSSVRACACAGAVHSVTVFV